MTGRSHRSRALVEFSFFTVVAVGVAALAGVTILTWRGASALYRQSAAATCGCDPVAASTTLPTVPALLIALGGLYLGAVIGRVVVSALRLRRLAAAIRQTSTSPRLARLTAGLHLVPPAIEIESAGSDAFCAGIFRPKLYVNRAALADLSDHELSAVLAHEQYHLRHRDPLRLMLVDALTFPWRFIPGFSSFGREFRSAVELAADESAVAAIGGSDGLSSALLKMVRPADTTSPVAGFSGVMNRRIDQLLGRKTWLGSARLLVLSAILAGALISLAGTANARVSSLENKAGSMSVGQCREQRIRSCVAPPPLTPMQSTDVTLVSTP